MNSEAGPKHWRIRLQTLYKSQSTEQKASLRAQLKEGFERKALRSVSDRTYDRWLNNEVDPGKEHADFAYAVMKEILSRLEENPADGRSAVPAGASVSPSGVQPVEVAVRRALEKQFELEKWLHPDEQGRYDRYFRDAHKDLETLLAESDPKRRSELEANLECCFAEPDRYYPQSMNSEWITLLRRHGDSQAGDLTLHRELQRLRELLGDEPISICVPLVALKYHCILEFVREYFALNLEVRTSEITKTAVQQVNEGITPDFVVAALVTFLFNARGSAAGGEGARGYQLGSAFYMSHQRQVIAGSRPPSDGGRTPLYYLENATGEVAVHQILRDSPQRYTPRPKSSSRELFAMLPPPSATTRRDGEQRALSLWEPACSYYAAEYGLEVENRHEHLLGVFVHPRWRTAAADQIGPREDAFYRLLEFGSAAFSKSSERRERFFNRMCGDQYYIDRIAMSIGARS